ncbi:MAG: prepilin-type N-terminal cleavage/methylation domain-containing protein, partial [Leptolyngbyaceae cyanobacterium T60_A2020_046]|nr:prepilin-type N-terminal cleavage/methylation domain-containing protein [Leptolyngbyaceae cyanobacterium T60_A2020_046]
MKSSSALLRVLRSRLRPTRRFQAAGFTLLELLVTLLIGSLITSGLLYLVVEMLKIERRETAIDQTQRDMQRAIEFIADDVEEAVYVYPTPEDAPALKGLLPAGGPTVLAFWRIDPIDDLTGVPNPTCGDSSVTLTPVQQEACVLRTRQAAYTLVLYQQVENQPADLWKGKTRIIRHEFRKYTDLTTLAKTAGYVDPIGTDANGNPITFENWPSDNPTPSVSNVLVDFVDAPNAPVTEASILDCPTDQVRSPSSTTSTSTSFFACIREPSFSATGSGNVTSNQDIEIFLRGNY